MKKLVRATAALIAIFALVSGCTAPAPSAPPTPSAAKQVRALWRVPVNLVGVPQVVGNTIVSYFRVKNRLLVGAWDLANGRLLWKARATTSGETPGIELSVETVTVKKHAYVAFIKSGRYGAWNELVIADVRTGPRKATKTMAVWASSSPESCSDGKAFCLLGYRPSAEDKQVNLRIDPERPALVVDHSDGIPANSRLIGPDIFATDDRRPNGVERLGRTKDGKVVWQRPYTDVFGASASSDVGWAFLNPYKGVIAGIGYPDRCTTATTNGVKRMTCDETRSRMVGLNNDTGATVWSLEHADACPSTSILAGSSDDRIIICRTSAGSSTYVVKNGWWKLESLTRQSELIAVKQQTGEVLWHNDLGKQTGADDPASFISSEDQLLLRINGKTTSYDLATGSATPVAGSAKLMCERDRPELLLRWQGDEEAWGYNIGKDVEPCDSTGKAIKTIAAEWVPEAGIDAGEDRWLMATPGAMMLVTLS